MRLLVIGCGKCGNRLAKRFAVLGKKARAERRIQIIASSLAVTIGPDDSSDLSAADEGQIKRVILGDEIFSTYRKEGKNSLAADIARNQAIRVIESVNPVIETGEVDAFMLLAAAGGATGSGMIPALTRALKNYFPTKPAYNLIVLPFVEEETANPAYSYNSATCLKSAYLAADAVFLVDNQKYAAERPAKSDILDQINAKAVSPFYNLLCAGEEKNPSSIGGKTLDAGDIIQSLTGWTVIGRGTERREKGASFIPALGTSKRHPVDGQLAVVEEGISLVSEALDELSLECDPQKATRALYLLTAPPEMVRISLLKEIGNSLKKAAPNAIIRSGDYPRKGHASELSLILSGLTDVSRVTGLFSRAIRHITGKSSFPEPKTGFERPDEEAFHLIPLIL